MAVIRTRKDSTPSDEVPSGGAGGKAPSAPVDRTRSVVRQRPSQAPRSGARTPGRASIPGGAPLSTSNESGSFARDTITELKRVVWPTKEDVRAGTIVTVGMLIFFSLYIFGLDFLVEQFFKMLGFYN